MKKSYKIILLLAIFLLLTTYTPSEISIFKSQKKGIYIDIGCGHPIKNNNTYLLNKKGWSGINIDLDEENISLFNAYRNKDFNISYEKLKSNGVLSETSQFINLFLANFIITFRYILRII